jgi:hypothetical protein
MDRVSRPREVAKVAGSAIIAEMAHIVGAAD